MYYNWWHRHTWINRNSHEQLCEVGVERLPDAHNLPKENRNTGRNQNKLDKCKESVTKPHQRKLDSSMARFLNIQRSALSPTLPKP